MALQIDFHRSSTTMVLRAVAGTCLFCGGLVHLCVHVLVVRFNAYQISASIDAKNNGFTRELRCPPVLIYFTQACREAGVRLVQVTLKDWTLNAFRRNASSAGWP